ncbi:MAG: AAA family ATPase [Polyangiaceae bacterium]|jgi:hypothetical protein|nr:AAA family ATPase [Polyangiaceae bacterium]
MARARLLSIEVERFKSYEARTHLNLAPLTVLVGRNNSGKSSLVQALLLLKQTLDYPRTEVSLHLEGAVEAISLQELTSGWPGGDEDSETIEGPAICLTFESEIDLAKAREAIGKTSKIQLKEGGLDGFSSDLPKAKVQTEIRLQFRQEKKRAFLASVALRSLSSELCSRGYKAKISKENPRDHALLNGNYFSEVDIEWDHFLPVLSLKRSMKIGPRAGVRLQLHLWTFLFVQPLEDLRAVLRDFGYLSSLREPPPLLYRAATTPPETLGVSGQYAAQLLHARRNDRVHYLPPLQVEGGKITELPSLRAQPLEGAVNDVLASMGVHGKVSIAERDLGFQLLFGKSNFQHVGRGLTYLLPVIEYGLLLDPRRFDSSKVNLERVAFLAQLQKFSHGAIEEPEAHVHPKLQSSLAHWFVALARSGRNLIVETHSDHLVRRLRGLIARVPEGSEMETWLRENVRIVEVSQDAKGRSRIDISSLTSSGDVERWPSDFMDVATDEERDIYDAGLDKRKNVGSPGNSSGVIHDEGEEPDDDGEPPHPASLAGSKP